MLDTGARLCASVGVNQTRRDKVIVMQARDVQPGDRIGVEGEDGRYFEGSVRMSINKGEVQLIGFVPASVPSWLLEESSGSIWLDPGWPVDKLD